MSRFIASRRATDVEERAGLEHHFPFASLLIAAVVAAQIASTILMLVAQR
jgi:hypothetical protein